MSRDLEMSMNTHREEVLSLSAVVIFDDKAGIASSVDFLLSQIDGWRFIHISSEMRQDDSLTLFKNFGNVIYKKNTSDNL